MGEGAANEPTGAPHSVHRGTAVQPLPCSVRGPAGLPVLSMATSAMGDSLELSYKRLLGDKKKKKGKRENSQELPIPSENLPLLPPLSELIPREEWRED